MKADVFSKMTSGSPLDTLIAGGADTRGDKIDLGWDSLASSAT